jgi:beta-lactamase regulating signal transducer with metallopeptidase domain
MRADAWLNRLEAISPAFIDAALRGAVVLVIALVLTHLLRRRSAAMRHLIWVGAIVVQLLLPLFALWGPSWNVAMPGQVSQFMPVEEQQAGPSLRSGRQDERSGRQVESVVPTGAQRPRDLLVVNEAPKTPISGRQILLALWAIGALVVFARLAIGTTIVASLARKGNRIDDGNWLSLAQKLSATLQIDRPLTLLRGHKLGVPVTWGIVYPVVLLPEDADAWPEERRRFVLVHEMAHVKRLDALTQLAGQFALALFWFNPLVWVANRRMQMEREHACDDYVLRHGTQASTYAEELLAMVRSLGSSSHESAQPAFAALAMARRSEFEGRMLSILDPVLDRHPLSKGRTVVSAAAALLLVVPIAALHPYRRAEAAPMPAPVAAAPVQPKVAAPATDLPESFKISISPASKDTAALARMLEKPLEKLTTGAEKLAVATTSLASQATAMAKSPGCESTRFGAESSNSTSLHANESDDGTVIIDYTSTNSARCASATILGKLKYSEAEDAIVEMPFGSHASFRYRTSAEDRMLVVTRGADGAVQHAYRFNGRAAEYDEEAKRWFASFLPSILMETGVNVAPRVARWRAEGGTARVLSGIAAMRGSSAKRSHYMALLDGPKLSSGELDDVVRSASDNLTASSSDMRAVLTRAAPGARISRQGMTSLERALAGMSSSGDKTAVLQRFGDTDDREMLMMVLRGSDGVTSSGDRARLYQVLAGRYLSREDRDLTGAYFDHVKQLPSSGDMRNTLMMALRHATQSPTMMRQLINASRSVASSGDLANVLIAVASSGGVTKELRDDFFAAAAGIASEGDRSRVLQVAASAFR